MKGNFFDFSFAVCSLNRNFGFAENTSARIKKQIGIYFVFLSLNRIFVADMKRITIISSLLAALFLSFSCGGNPSPDGEAGRRLALLDEYETEVYSTAITDETDEITLPSTLR